ncbi:hypothetical protein MA16_Dca015751 [Dendrobium catenatum]|uniref:Uncharacterized protein n=1 Tax=Dendrobium catenatum TaxID=906689 RepID=A0A2I0WHU3_9ASPA|nr:hypothetical protein MA16_Dca015751 [Dendrobium catenatum]
MPFQKSLNRPIISLERGAKVREEGEEKKDRREELLLDHRHWNSIQVTSEFRPTSK